jgi:hypothetical protein
MNPAVTTHAETAPTPSDEALLAEIAPAMLAKLKADSRQQGITTGILFAFINSFVLPAFVKQTDGWLELFLILFGIVLCVCTLVTLVRAYIGQPSMLRDELRYRREHGKWRWER